MTRRRLAIVGGVVVVAVVLVVWIVGRDSDDRSPAGQRSASTMGAAEGRRTRSSWTTNDDAPKGTLRVEGQVIDDHEKPVAGATVMTWAGDLVTTVSEADGSFFFEDLRATRHVFVAHKGDQYAPKVIVRVHEKTEPVILRMRRGMTVAITVVEADGGAPIAGATVHESMAGDVTTDARGLAEFRGVSDFFHMFEARATGRAPAAVSFMVNPDPGGRIERTIALARGAPVAGTVVGPDDRPVGGARVHVENEAGGWGDEAECDANGRWRFEALASGRHTFVARARDHASGGPTTLELDATPRDGVVVRVVRGGEVAGMVVDGNTRPVAGATVAASKGIADDHAGAYTDANGTFRIRGLSSGGWQLTALAGSTASPLVKVDVSDKPVTDVRLVVAEGLIAGVVVDGRGNPVPEIQVTGMPDGEFTRLSNDDDVTDSAGRFELGPLPPGGYWLHTGRPGVENPRRFDDRVIAKTGARDVRIVLPDVAGVSGAVALDGKPVTDYFVAFSHPGGFAFQAPTTGVHDQQGRFAMDVAAGTITVIVTGSPFATKQIEGVVVAGGKTTDLGTIAVERGRVVTGRVVDAKRAPVEGARVVAGAMAGSFARRESNDVGRELMYGIRATTTGKDGRFELRGVEGSKRTNESAIVAVHPTRGRVDRKLGDSDRAIELVLAATGSIAGTVRSAPGRAAIDIDQVDGSSSELVHPSAGGAFRADGLAPGKYRVRALIIPDRVGPSAEVDVKAGATVSVDLEFPRDTITLAVTVHGDCLMLYLAAANGEPLVHKSCSTGATVIEFEGVIPGDYRVCGAGHCVPVSVAKSPARQTLDLKDAKP